MTKHTKNIECKHTPKAPIDLDENRASIPGLEIDCPWQADGYRAVLPTATTTTTTTTTTTRNTSHYTHTNPRSSAHGGG